ncbi:uncharacterized protein LOC128252391 [Drosophila gunungcola]|uniref:uncharacterized protein LOC128252391 n=1 Tax=Drosophila gunungcola TaxID=103775 RepID=UPI0022E3A59F|nr:uncharacterized protein LOC128252391 [Drosophila gunungcola]
MDKHRPYLTKGSTQPNPASFSKRLHGAFELFARGATRLIDYDEQKAGKNDILVLGHSKPPLDVLMEHVQSNKYADVAVTVKGHSFICHSLVLCIYSKRMVKELDSNCMFINTPQLTAKGFSEAYQWMVSEHADLDPSNFIDVMRAAYYLKIPDLIDSCWQILNSELFDEFSAFGLMYQGRNAHELAKIHDLLAGRLSKSMLRVASSREFLGLSERQVCGILQSNSLAVNSEMEVLYSALMWLNHLWPKRSSSTHKILKNIRFGYLPPTMLSKFKSRERNKVGSFGPILNVFAQLPGLTRLIQDGVFYSSLIMTSHKDSKYLLESIEYNQLKLINPRKWVRDSKCGYHHVVSPLCPNMRYISFQQFKEYLYQLQIADRYFDQFMSYAEDIKDGKEVSDLQDKQNVNEKLLHSRLSELSLSQYVLLVKNNFSQFTKSKKKENKMKNKVVRFN